MRIVYVLNTLAVGGTERQVLAIAERLAVRGHAVALMVLRPREMGGYDTGLDIVYLDIQKKAVSIIAGLRRATAFIGEFRPDVIHSHNFHGNMLARLVRLVRHEPKVISTIHNVYEGGWLRMLAYRLSDRQATRVTAVSTVVAERYVQLESVAKSKIVVVTNGIDTVHFVPNAERRAVMRRQLGVRDEFVWLWVGRLTAAKDFPNLLQAFGRVWEASVNTRLWIVGEASPARSDEALDPGFTVPHGAMECVCRLGLRHDIAGLLDAADGFVLSSAWEGMPLALGEAMAMAKPAVATDVGGVRQLAGETALVVPAKDSNALAEAMRHVMSRSADKRAAMGHAARERIRSKFNMDAKADEWEALYRSVLD